MSSLTKEQLQRIEESKRKAQERLARKRPALPSTSRDLPPPKQPAINNPAHPQSRDFSGGTNHVTNKKPSLTIFKKLITAVLLLRDHTHFKVLVQYDAQLIEIFKGIPSRLYDATTQTWSFGLQDYQKLVQSAREKTPHVTLNLIPKPILDAFLTSSDNKGRCGATIDKTTPINYGDKIGTQLYGALMDFQKEGVEYCIHRNGRCLIADDMGLGKTLQAIAVVKYYRMDWPLLVVCPSSLKIAWSEAFQRWIPSLSRDDITVVMTTKCPVNNSLVTIISYDLLVKLSKDIHQPGVVIADESHFLKNYKTARAKAALPLLKKAKRALLLSGTPALSRPIELYTQITAVDKKFNMSIIEYGKRYCNGVQNAFGWDFSGSSNMSELQLYLEERLMIRRLKINVLHQLPSKLRQTVILDPSMTKGRGQEWKELQQQLGKVSALKKGIDRKTALLPLFSKTGLMKLPAIKDYILDQLQGDRKLLVFAHHKEVMDRICDFLSNKKFSYVRIDGSTPSDVRQTYCDKFQHDRLCQLAILSITAANTGLTLTAASCVIFAELFWNPGVLVQAEDRVYRIGQHNSVNIHYLVARETVDDFIWPMIQRKLKVLTQAGLAVEDFTSIEASSHVFKSMDDKQMRLEDWLPDDTTSSTSCSTSCFTSSSIKNYFTTTVSSSTDDTTSQGEGEREGERGGQEGEGGEREGEEGERNETWFESLNETDISLLLNDDCYD